MTTTVYDFTVLTNTGQPLSLTTYQGKVLMIVNTATRCGLTAQYRELQSLYQKYQPQGFEILDFPCNQFREQTPEDDNDIHTFCTTQYGTTFPRFAKIEVNGTNQNALYQWLKHEQPADTGDKKFADLHLCLTI